MARMSPVGRQERCPWPTARRVRPRRARRRSMRRIRSKVRVPAFVNGPRTGHVTSIDRVRRRPCGSEYDDHRPSNASAGCLHLVQAGLTSDVGGARGQREECVTPGGLSDGQRHFNWVGGASATRRRSFLPSLPPNSHQLGSFVMRLLETSNPHHGVQSSADERVDAFPISQNPSTSEITR